MKVAKVDKVFLTGVLILILLGLFIFTSAAMGLVARQGASFSSVAFNHIFFGIILGSVAMFITSRIHYREWRKWSFWIFVSSLILTAAVFIPGVGFSHGGATRWIAVGSFTFQPAEFLKIGYLVYLAAWLSAAKEKIGTFKKGFLPFLAISGITGIIMLLQPDTDSFIVMVTCGLAMYFAAGGRKRYIFGMALIGVALLAILAFQRPYIMQRIMTFANPAADPQGAGYQIQQSLIAIGSGGVFGRGFGQSIQKFNFLPEPIGDSIFAVQAEEFGFLGSIILLFLLCFFAIRGLKISLRAPDSFGGLLVVGIVILIASQSFVNIGSMLGVLPLSGLPLIFVSHGGTAMLFALAEVGMILNVSRYQRTIA